MSKIVVGDDSSLETLEIRLEHLLFGEKEIDEERKNFKSLAPLVGVFERSLPPLLVTEGRLEEAYTLLKGSDDLELLFLTVLSNISPSHTFAAVEGAVKEHGWTDLYQNLLVFLFIRSDREWGKNAVLPLLLSVPIRERTPLTLFLTVLYGDSDVPEEGQSAELRAARFVKALHLEKNGDAPQAFSALLNLFESTGYPRFIYELLKIMMAIHDTIPVEEIDRFVDAVVESPLAVPYSVVRFLEFLYHYKTGHAEKIEHALTVLAESTDSLFVLHALAPLLHRYKKWHLLSKFYKLASSKLVGEQRVLYMKMLADLYDTKLEMPEFSVELHKNIIEDNIDAGFFSLSRVLTVYEETEQWNELLALYTYLAEHERDVKLQAYYSFRAGEVLYQELERPEEARVYIEKSLESRRSFEAVRLLSEIYLKLSDYDAYIAALEKELEFQMEVSERIRVLDITADAYSFFKQDFVSAEKYLLRILEYDARHLQTLKKLGKLYYRTKSWRKLVDINKKEYAISDNKHDRLHLIYKNGVICYRELNDFDCAEQNFSLILQQDKNHISSLLYLERIYSHREDYDKLIELYERLIADSDDLSKSKQYYLMRLALIYREKGEHERSMELFTAVVDSFPADMLAREYIRIGKGDLTLSSTSFGSEVASRELLDVASTMGQGASSLRGVVSSRFADNSFWYYLYSVVVGETVDGKPEADETYQFLYQLLHASFSIDTLVANSGRRVALIALIAAYIERQCYQGVYTVLNYYLKVEPVAKRQFWSLFFRGMDFNDLTERLEAFLVEDQKAISLELLVTMIESLYEQQGDFRTILFLRSVYIKKEDDIVKKRAAIDSTIERFADKVDARSLLEFYRLRFAHSTGQDRRNFVRKYREYLEKLNMKDALVKLYETMWEEEHNPDDGAYLMGLYREGGRKDDVARLAELLLESGSSNDAVLKELVSLYNDRGEYEKSLQLLGKQFPETIPSDNELVMLWFDALVAVGKQMALSAFVDRITGDFDFTAALVEQLIARKYNTQAKQVIYRLPKDSVEHCLKIVELLLKVDVVVPQDVIECSGGFLAVKDLFVLYRGQSAVKKTAKMLAEDGDSEAAHFLFDMAVDEGDTEMARSLIESDVLGSEALLLESKLFKVSGELAKEVSLLVSHIAECVKGEWYPLKRLHEIAVRYSDPVAYMLSCMLSSYDDKYQPSEHERTKFLPPSRALINRLMGMGEYEQLVFELAKLLSLSKRPMMHNAQPLTATMMQREVLSLFDHAKMIHDDMNIDAYFRKEGQEEPLIGIVGRVPALVVSPQFGELSRDEILLTLFRAMVLVREGFPFDKDNRGIEETVEQLRSASQLRGKDRVAFVRSVRESDQSRVAALLSTIEHVEWHNLARKIADAALLHAFYLLPDPLLLQRVNGEEGFAYLDSSSATGAMVARLLHYLISLTEAEEKSHGTS